MFCAHEHARVVPELNQGTSERPCNGERYLRDDLQLSLVVEVAIHLPVKRPELVPENLGSSAAVTRASYQGGSVIG